MWVLKQSTASQVVEFGPFLDDTDFKTAKTGLTIANTDIKINKHGGTTHISKNSGGGTHIANGYYYATFDATDTDTVGRFRIHVNVATALPVWLDCWVLEETIYDSLFAASAAAFDATGQVTVGTNADKTGYALSTAGLNAVFDHVYTGNTTANTLGSDLNNAVNAPANFTDLSITAGSGRVSIGSSGSSALNAAAFASDTNVYAAKVSVLIGSTVDIYQVAWFKNETLQTSGVTSPQIQVIKETDGTDLVAATAMSAIGSTPYFKKESSTRMVAGSAYIAVVTATIDGSTRTWAQPVGRDA